jgi:hypothetical protein
VIAQLKNCKTSASELLIEARQWPGLVQDWAWSIESEDLISLSLIGLCFYMVITTLIFFEVKSWYLRRRPRELVEAVTFVERISKEEFLRQSVDFT